MPLRVRLAAQPGKKGVGTIAEADLDPDLLCYLQTCPSWNSLAEKHWKKGTKAKSVRAVEAALGLKSEFPGIVDGENPPTCRSLNGDKNLLLFPSERFAAFVRAIRKSGALGCNSWAAKCARRSASTVCQKPSTTRTGSPS